MNTVLRAGTASLLTVVFSFMNIMTGCKSAATPSTTETRLLPRLRLHPRVRRRRK